MTSEERIDAAVELAIQHGMTDGGHHKMWVIDQMLRALTGDDALIAGIGRTGGVT